MRYNSILHIFPEQCAKYLHDKFRMHNVLTVRELMVILKRIGIKTVKIHNNGKIYDVFYKREIDGIQDFEFLNNLHEYRKLKQIRDEWSKEPLIDYTPELSNMQNASDELLRQDDVYYTNESQKQNINYNMKKFLKESYEPEIKNGLYNTALMNLDDVRKSLPKNTSKEIWDLYQQLFDALENENVNSINSDSDGFTIFIQAVDPFDTDYLELRKFEGHTFHLDNVQKIDKIEQERLGVEDCEYCGYINFEGHELPIPFSKDIINSKKPYSYQWIYACYIRYKIQESKNMKRDNKKTLYESIMSSVAREVKKALNEDLDDEDDDYEVEAEQYGIIYYKDIIKWLQTEDKFNIELYANDVDEADCAAKSFLDWENPSRPEYYFHKIDHSCAVLDAITNLSNELLSGSSINDLYNEYGDSICFNIKDYDY